MTERTVNNALPKLPGFDFSALNQPQTFAKSQCFGFSSGGVPHARNVVSQPITTLKGSTAGGPSGAAFPDYAIFRKFPLWKTLDGKVLRFFGYFTERVTESSTESMRVRKVSVLHFLTDRSTQVSESVTTANSGLRVGTLMSRHVDSATGTHSFSIGAVLALRGLSINIVDCDAFTRDFYQTMGCPLSEAMDYPPDKFELMKDQKPVPATRDPEYKQLKQAMEMIAVTANGHPAQVLTAEEVQRTQNFLKHDREVLNFSATWEKRNFRISFYLMDGTMSVNNVKAANDGRDPVAAFIKRGKIAKGKYTLKSIDTVTPPRETNQEFFTEEDLATGTTINLLGRDLFLYDCDGFTRDYYRAKYGIEMRTFSRGDTEADGKAIVKAVMENPPYNGFGTEEDSLGSFKHMVPRVPKKDYAKYIHHANDVLRFSAQIDNPLPEDVGRAFIVCFYLADDTVSVFEYAVRNSGHTGGKVFSRAKVPSITASTMVVGNTLKLGGHVYRLLETDERTTRFLETGESMGAVRDTKAEELIDKVRVSLTQRFSRVADAYKHFNASRTGIGFLDLKKMFAECEVKVENEELLAEVMRLCDTDCDGVISLQEFVDNILKQNLVRSDEKQQASAAGNGASARDYLAFQQQKSKREFANKALAKFVEKLEARRAYIVDAFRIVSDGSVDGLIGIDAFKQVVTDRLGLMLSDEEMDALVYRFYYTEQMPDYTKRRLTLRDFRRVLEA